MGEKQGIPDVKKSDVYLKPNVCPNWQDKDALYVLVRREFVVTHNDRPKRSSRLALSS